jgi:hypothetical protein
MSGRGHLRNQINKNFFRRAKLSQIQQCRNWNNNFEQSPRSEAKLFQLNRQPKQRGRVIENCTFCFVVGALKDRSRTSIIKDSPKIFTALQMQDAREAYAAH